MTTHLPSYVPNSSNQQSGVESSTRFILNNLEIRTVDHPGTPLLDFIRYTRSLTGTRCGCREGDCGACLVLIGETTPTGMKYHAVPSCITPLGGVQGKHVVTIEGLNTSRLTPIQQSIAENGATQCGFCSPGIIISITAAFLSESPLTTEKILGSVDGNICRCTGYKSIERAAISLSELFTPPVDTTSLDWLVTSGIIPEWFTTIRNRLELIASHKPFPEKGIVIAGGTDLLVQKPELIGRSGIHLMDLNEMKCITVNDGICRLGAGLTFTEIMHSKALQEAIPWLEDFFRLMASTPVRNRGTIGGNLANASPIADLAIFFMALDATLLLVCDSKETREIGLQDFFRSYRQTALHDDECIHEIRFSLPDGNTLFNFEKVSKREHLDIASVNSAMCLKMSNGVILHANITAGGVAPVPLLLRRASQFLCGKKPGEDVVAEACRLALSEISPISDIRGSIAYKRLLLRQLVIAHFTTIFPETFIPGMVASRLLQHDPQ